MSATATLSQALTKGKVIGSGSHRYRVESMIGSGGFGITYRVVRLSDGMIFALKEYFPSSMCQREHDDTLSYLKTNTKVFQEGVDNFITEAKRLTKINLNHPNLISVEEVFEANNTAYYVMEYIDGENLRKYISKQRNKPLTSEQTLSVMRPILRAMALLHQNNLTHLDIKPDNIVLTEEEDGSLRPVIIDFGQSKHYDRKGNATSVLTNAGCSDGYSPQEQYLGLEKFTPQADVYALCATMLFLLTAKQPPKSSDISTSYIEKTLPPEISSQVRNALVNGLRKDKDDRTQSVERLAGDLGLDIASQTGEGNVTRLLNIHRRRDIDYSRFLIPAGVAVLAAIIGGGVYWYVNRPAPTQSDLLTKAIATGGFDELKRFAELDSVRAFLPYSELLIQKEDFDKGIEFAEKALSTPDSVRAGELIVSAHRLIASRSQEPASDNPVTKPQEPADNTEELPTSSEKTSDPIETNDEKFLRAQRENNFNALLTLAKSNYAKAYYPVALGYFNRGNNKQAEIWAKKAVTANVYKQEAGALLKDLKKETTPSNAELVRKAKSISELRDLANRGIKEAYAPLSKMEYDATNYERAKELAELAQKNGVATSASRKVLSDLENENF